MKKRLKLKILKEKNLNKHEDILREISQHFTIETKKFGNGYFIFAFGKHSVCHFTLKETPDWYYGIWLDEKGYQIFGEHDDLIDKFKPSRTYISFADNLNGFIEKAKAVQKEPILHFVNSMTNGKAVHAYLEHGEGDDIWYTGYQVVREYNEETKLWDIYKRDTSITQDQFVKEKYEEHVKEKEERKKNEECDRKYAFSFFKELPFLFEEIKVIGIKDGNARGWITSPRYSIKVAVDSDCSQEKLDELFNQLNQLIHDKNYSGERITYEHQFDFDGIYYDMEELRDCHYQYKKKKQKTSFTLTSIF